MSTTSPATPAVDPWRTPARRAGRLLARIVIRRFPRRFGIFELLALGSLEWMRRHLAVINELERLRAERPLMSVLDFGGADGALGRALDLYGLADHYEVTVADIDLSQATLRRPIRALASIDPDGKLPFADGSFDVVASSDVFEHIPPEARPRWATELHRVSRGGQVHTMPCDSADGRFASTAADRRFAAWYTNRFGEPERWTEEHLAMGTPQLEEVTSLLSPSTVRPIVNVDVWFAAMVAKHGSTGISARLRFLARYLVRFRRRAGQPPFKNAVFVVPPRTFAGAGSGRSGDATGATDA